MQKENKGSETFVGIVHLDEFKDCPDVHLVFTPIVTKERYALMVGTTVGQVEGQIKLGHIPTIKQGKRRFVNLAKILDECMREGAE